ncbi:B12-binding domain-containing radical SAM protein [Patescibacteria group bacterium]|nr:B12-binding domain-containing radical SAM protein [Patescibacteria group bacterium]
MNVWKSQMSMPHFGLTSLAAYILNKSPNIKVTIVEGFNPLKQILASKPDIVGFTSDTLLFNDTKKVAIALKKRLSVPLLIGGVHITASPKSFSQPFDIGVVGEGEETLLEILTLFSKSKKFPSIHLEKIKGILFISKNKLIVTPRRPLLPNIDLLPYPARNLTPMKEVYLQKQLNPYGIKRLATVMTSRGCPYHCVFCGSPVQWGRVRFHSPLYIVNEIKKLIADYQVDGIMFWDDLFIAPYNRLVELKDLIIAENLHHRIKFIGYARANLIDEKTCKILKEMNVKRLIFGLESASPKILDYLKQHSVTVEDNRRAVTLCRRYQITTSSGYIVGTPGETVHDLQDTFDFMKKYPLDNTQIYILTPYPGTVIWPSAQRINLVSDNMDYSRLFVQLPSITLRDLTAINFHLLDNRIFLNTEYRYNKEYLELIHKIRLLAFFQNFKFYLNILPQNALNIANYIISRQFSHAD